MLPIPLRDAFGVCGGCPEQDSDPRTGAAIFGGGQSQETRQQVVDQSLPYGVYRPDCAGIRELCRGHGVDVETRGDASHAAVAGLRIGAGL